MKQIISVGRLVNTIMAIEENDNFKTIMQLWPKSYVEHLIIKDDTLYDTGSGLLRRARDEMFCSCVSCVSTSSV